jgi:catechol 2,3-dioxygenase-like lactoylglutathione lyase family enzyme
MMRVKDIKKSLDFYCGKLGMTLLSSSTIGEGESWAFSLYFLAHVPTGHEEAAKKQVRRLYSFLLPFFLLPPYKI